MSTPSKPGSRTIVRFVLPRRARVPLVHVRLNGEFDGVFIVDTGASASVLSSAAAGRCGIRTTSARARTLGAAGAVRARDAALKSLQVGAVEVKRVPLAVIDLGPISRALSRRIDGVLGNDVLRRFVVTLDYRKRRITLIRSGAAR